MPLSRARVAIIARRLLSEESLTSWFVRVARANAMSQHELGSVLLGKTVHGSVSVDLDLFGAKLLEALASSCGVRYVDVRLASLKGWATSLSDGRPGHPQPTRWILDRRSAGYQRRLGTWTQACPLCLAEDEDPFFRAVWRIAFITECPVHHVQLIDRCSRCLAPLDFSRDTELTRKTLTDLAQCPQCHANWREEITSMSQKHLAAWQGRLLRALSEGWVVVGHSAVALPLYLEGVFRLQRLLRRPAGRRLRRAMQRNIGIGSDVESSSLPFERLSVGQRRTELATLSTMLDSWPARFVEFGREAELRWSDITEERSAHVPYWLERIGRAHFDRTWYQPSEQELKAIRDFLFQHGHSSRPTLVREWSGGWVQVRRVSLAPVSLEAPEQLRIGAVGTCCYGEEFRSVWIRRLVVALRRYCIRMARKSTHRPRQDYVQLEFCRFRTI